MSYDVMSLEQRTIIDVNCDLGEGIGNEKDLMPLLSSCNIACGGHAGSTKIMKEIALLANSYGVLVGAHPSYPDRENFGRLSMVITETELIASIRKQVQDFMSVLEKNTIPLHHIKAHGALYNDIAKDRGLARAFLKAIAQFRDSTFLYVPFGSIIALEAPRQGFAIKNEAFIDRNYNADLSLVSRKLAHALILKPELVLEHLLPMIRDLRVRTVNDKFVSIRADTYCVHGDTPYALQILTYLSVELPKLNIHIEQ